MTASSTSLSRLTRSLFRLSGNSPFLSNPFHFSESSILPASHLRNLWTTPSHNEPKEAAYSSESSPESESEGPEIVSGDQPPLNPSSPAEGATRIPLPYRLENGMDVGVYRAILVGQAGQAPVQKKLKSGRTVTLFSVGTGGIRNNRRPFDDEDPKQYAARCSVQWHRACVYTEPLGRVAMEHVRQGSILFIEGNLETKIFTDPISGLPRRIREIAIRRDGRIVFLGKEDDIGEPPASSVRAVGYF